MKKEEKHYCQVCKEKKDDEELFPCELLRPSLADFMEKSFTDWKPEGMICIKDLNTWRGKYIEHVMKTEEDETKELQEEVITSMAQQEVITRNVNAEFSQELTFGERLADKIAEFGGSWKFIITFAVILLVWIAVNTWILLSKPFDPYPYILLNLVLSCLAALQAPVIMMSQNRQEAKDRLRGEHDYKVNLKAELEIRHLNEKIDHLLMKQWQRLMEIQQFQTEIMEQILNKKKE